MSDFWTPLGSRYDEVNDNTGGLADRIRAYQAQQNQQASLPATSSPTPDQSGSYGAAGLPGAASALSVPAAMTGLGGAGIGAAAAAAPLAVPLAAAYGLGRLIAPDKVDAAIGKVKGFLADKIPALESMGSGYETGLAESIPGSQLLKKLLPEQAQQKISAVEQANPGATLAGKTAGIVGQMALPGLNLVKGAGLGADIANAAINVAPYAIGTGLDVGATTGSPVEGLKAAGLSELAGTAIPGAIGAITKNPAIQRALAKLQIGAAGERTGDFVRVLRGAGKSMGLRDSALDSFVANKADDLITRSADMIDQFGYTKAGKEAMRQFSKNGFEAHAQLWDEATGKAINAGDMASVRGDTDLKFFRGALGDEAVDKAVSDMGRQIDGVGWTKSRSGEDSVLGRYIKAGGHAPPKSQEALDGAVAGAWKDYLDSGADNLADMARQQGANIPDLHLLKATYPATLVAKKALGREGAGISERFFGGSDTAARLALEGLMGGSAAATSDWSSPENIPGNLAKIAAASVAGRMMTRGVGRAAEIGTGMAAGALRNAPDMGGVLAPILGRTGGVLGASGEPQTPPGAQPIATAPQMAPAMAKNVDAIKNAQAGMDSQTQAEASVEAQNAFQATIDAKIRQKWESMSNNPLRPDYQTYYDSVKSWTGGSFDPTRPETMKILGGADFKKYQQTYLASMNLRRMGPNLVKALAGWPLSRDEHDALVNSIWLASSGDSKPPDGAARKQIESTLGNLKLKARLGMLHTDQAFSSLMEIMRSEGLPVDQLQQMGAFNGK